MFVSSFLIIILYTSCSDKPIPGYAPGALLVFFCALAFLLSCLRFYSPSRLDQAATMSTDGALPGFCMWSHLLILLLCSPRSSPFYSPPSMSRRLATRSMRGVHCPGHVASLRTCTGLCSRGRELGCGSPLSVSSFGRKSSLLFCIVWLRVWAIASSRPCCLSTSFPLACELVCGLVRGYRLTRKVCCSARRAVPGWSSP